MPDVMEQFPHLNEWDVSRLHQRYNELKLSSTPSTYSDETLQELVCIARVLRKKASGPPKAKAASATTKSAPPTVDML